MARTKKPADSGYNASRSIPSATRTRGRTSPRRNCGLCGFGGTGAVQPALSADPSLDPQLVWKGRISRTGKTWRSRGACLHSGEDPSQALIDACRVRNTRGRPDRSLRGLQRARWRFRQEVEFYQHDQHWSNRMILGDSLLVMASLAEKEGLKGKVQTIYFDPPTASSLGPTGSQHAQTRRERRQSRGRHRQPEQIRAFRDTWKLGIHSYLAYLRDRLTAARELLTETGSIFVRSATRMCTGAECT